MIVKYIGKKYENFLVSNNRIDLTPGKLYEVLKITKNVMYNVIDDSGEEYSYPASLFETVEE